MTRIISMKYFWYAIGIIVIAGLIILQRRKVYKESYESEITGILISILDRKDGISVDVSGQSITVSPFSFAPNHIKLDEIASTGDTVIKRAKSNVLVLKHKGQDYYYTIIQ